MRRSSKVRGIAILVFIIISACVWYVVLRGERGGMLTVSFLDVGQGDAIFIDAPSGRQVLIDGGKGSSVLRALSDVMPWYDRSIDVMIATHPDADHIGGLIDVLDRYEVGMAITSSVEGDTQMWRTLGERIAKEKARQVTALRGQIIVLGSGAYLEILFPDRLVPHLETNTGCVVARLVYGDTAFMLSCDAPQSIEKYLVALDGGKLRSDVLKAGHHGSKTSSALAFVGFVGPEYGVLSRGCDNTYGHPHQQTLDTFARLQISLSDTCTDGTVSFVSDGKTVQKI